MQIVLENDKLVVHSPSGLRSKIAWNDVHSVSANTIDCKTYQLTYLTFDFAHGEFVEIHDRMDGFSQVLADLPNYLDIKRTDWFDRVQHLKPADTPIVIFERSRLDFE